jgi:small subunit ribosomal protein S9
MADKYFYALGRRKTSTATVRLFKSSGKSEVNGKDIEKVYPHEVEIKQIQEPFVVAGLNPKDFYFTVKTSGGGHASQIDAVRLAISRSLVKMDPEFKPSLKQAGLMTRDPRMVERKKTGLRKARKKEQYSKR